MIYSVKRADQGIMDQWSVMQGPVRIAIVTRNPWLLVRGSIDGISQEVVEKMIDVVIAGEAQRRLKLRGGL